MTDTFPTSSPTFGRIDLHTHSNASDGTLTPAELAEMAVRRGVSVLALTDHDTTDGLAICAAACAGRDLEFIPGIELSTDVGDHEVHILGYFVNPRSERLASALENLREQRVDRTRRIVDKLRQLGLDISWERVRELAGPGSIGRPHIARAMIERGDVSSVSEAFDRYIGAGRPGFVPRTSKRPEEAVGLLADIGAVPVLAHPFSTGDVLGILAALIPMGLRGMEVHYGEYSIGQRAELAAIAARHGLIPTGGSDYHGPSFKEGRELGSVDVPLDTVALLRKVITA